MVDLKDLPTGTIIKLFLQEQGANIYDLLSASFQVVKRLFVFVYVIPSY